MSNPAKQVIVLPIRLVFAQSCKHGLERRQTAARDPRPKSLPKSLNLGWQNAAALWSKLVPKVRKVSVRARDTFRVNRRLGNVSGEHRELEDPASNGGRVFHVAELCQKPRADMRLVRLNEQHVQCEGDVVIVPTRLRYSRLDNVQCAPVQRELITPTVAHLFTKLIECDGHSRNLTGKEGA